MRNLIWSGTAVVLLVGAGLFVAVQHAARHPDSFVGRCAMTIYHLGDPLMAPRAEPRPDAEIVQAPLAAPLAAIKPAPAEVIEPIVVEPTDQEPPLAIPRLSPEIAAAIERLRGEEDSEAPPEAFDAPRRTPRMPYADEDVRAPIRISEPAPGRLDLVHLPGPCGFFFLPPSCLPTVFARVVEALRQQAAAEQGSEEPADEGTADEPSGDLQPIPFHSYDGHGCPYTGSYPSSYKFRYTLPRP